MSASQQARNKELHERIASLEAELEHLRQRESFAMNNVALDRIASLEAENARLRADLAYERERYERLRTRGLGTSGERKQINKCDFCGSDKGSFDIICTRCGSSLDPPLYKPLYKRSK
jgi:uncharacterized small protein (DUF1192 family)